MNILANKTNEQVYLEWLNEYSAKRMAEFYNVERYEIELMISQGRNEYLKKFESEAYKKIWLPKN